VGAGNGYKVGKYLQTLLLHDYVNWGTAYPVREVNFLRVGSLSSTAKDMEAVASQISGKLRQSIDMNFLVLLGPMLMVYPLVEVCVWPPSVVISSYFLG